MIKIQDLTTTEKLFILFIGNKQKYKPCSYMFDYNYKRLFGKFEKDGYVTAAISCDDNDSLTSEGQYLYDEIEKSASELSELQVKILDFLSEYDGDCHNIRKECKDLKYNTSEELAEAFVLLRSYELVIYFERPNDEGNVTWLSITDKGRIAVRELHNIKNDNHQNGNMQTTPSTGMPYVKLSSKRNSKINLIRLVWSLCQMGMFVDEKEKKVDDKTVFELLGKAFNVNLSYYSNNLSQSMKNDSNQAIENLFDVIREKANQEDFVQFIDAMKSKLIETFVQKNTIQNM